MLRLQFPSGLSKGGSGQSGWSCMDPPKSSEAASEALSLLSGAIQRTALLKGCCQSNLARPPLRRARRRMGPQLSASPGFSMRLFNSLKEGVLHVQGFPGVG